MDWTALAKQIEAGAKLYRIFEEGERADSPSANAEPAAQELQAQYDALTPQIVQAKEELRLIRANGDSARAEAARAAQTQQQALAAAYAKNRDELQAEADAWIPKLSALKAQFDSTLAAQLADVAALEGKIAAAKQQIATLESIKDTLKTQLEQVS